MFTLLCPLLLKVLGYYSRNNIDPKTLITEMESIASAPTERHYFHVAAEEALLEIAATLGDRIFNIEGRCYCMFVFAVSGKCLSFAVHMHGLEIRFGFIRVTTKVLLLQELAKVKISRWSLPKLASALTRPARFQLSLKHLHTKALEQVNTQPSMQTH